MTITVPRSLAVALLALVVASPAAAKGKKPVDPAKKSCRSEVPTGSRMPKTTCHTNAEWAQIDADNAAASRDIDPTARGSMPTQ